MRSQGEFVRLWAHSTSVLLTIGLILSGCGRVQSSQVTDTMSQSQKVPGSVIEIIRAIDTADISKLKSVLEGGANPTPEGSPLSPIHAAITHLREGRLVCDLTALKLLLDHGASPDFIDQHSGFSPLEDALAMGDDECARLLKEAGASIHRHGLSGQTLLQFAVKGAIRTGNTNILKLVLSWGVDPNVLSSGRANTALHEAAWANSAQDAAPIVAELLRNGADPCISDSEGDTALDLARYLNRSADIQKLLSDAMSNCPKK